MHCVFYFEVPSSHQISGIHECKFVNNFSFSITKNNIFDCQNRYYGNRKRLICIQRLQSKTLYLAIMNDLPLNKRLFPIAAYPVCSLVISFRGPVLQVCHYEKISFQMYTYWRGTSNKVGEGLQTFGTYCSTRLFPSTVPEKSESCSDLP